MTNRMPSANTPRPTVGQAGALGRDMHLRLAVWLADVSAEAAAAPSEMTPSAVPPAIKRAELPIGIRSIRRATRA